jgi:hypothetical protein
VTADSTGDPDADADVDWEAGPRAGGAVETGAVHPHRSSTHRKRNSPWTTNRFVTRKNTASSTGRPNSVTPVVYVSEMTHTPTSIATQSAAQR